MAFPTCPMPAGISKCPPITTYQVGGIDYVAFQYCDQGNNQDVLAIFQICAGVLSAPEYYDLAGNVYVPVGVVGRCKDSADYEILCDLGPNPNVRVIALFDTSVVPPKLNYYTPSVTGALTPYVPVGPISQCPGEDVEDVQTCFTALNAGAGYAAGDQIIQILFFNTGENPPVLTATIWRNQTQSTVLAAAPLAADLTPCAGGKDNEIEILCDDNAGVSTRFLRRYVIDALGGVTIHDTTLDGITPYTVAGTVTNCAGTAGSSDIIADCADAGRSAIAYGPELLTNGDFSQSTGTGATSDPAVGWTTGYTPVNDVYAAGAGTYAFFTTNAGAATGGNAAAAAVQALTGRSMVVNVGANTAQPILSWPNIFLENGKSYALEVDAAILGLPFGISIAVDGVAVVPVVSPVVTGQWQRTSTVFTYTGATGYHTVSLNSNNGAGAGNDHTFDNFSLRKAFPANTESLTTEKYDSVVRAIVDQIVESTGCNDDRRDKLLAEISNLLSSSDTDVVILCDDNGSFLRRTLRDSSGNVTVIDTTLDAVTLYVPVGTVKQCCSTSLVELCDSIAGNNTPGPVQTAIYTEIQDAQQKNNGPVHLNETNLDMGHITGLTDFIVGLRFAANIPQGATIASAYVQFNSEGVDASVSSISITGEDADNSSAFVAVNNNLTSRPKVAPTVNWVPNAWVNNVAGVDEKSPDLKTIIQAIVNRAGWAAGNTLALFFQGDTGHRRGHSLADGAALSPTLIVNYTTTVATGSSITKFYRQVDCNGTPTGNNYTLDLNTGALVNYVPVGTVDKCATSPDTELIVLCDDNRSFVRSIRYDSAGNVASTIDTTFDGSLYTPIGLVKVCDQNSGTLTDYEVYCGDSGCVASRYASPFNYLDHSDPDIQATVSVAGNNRTLNFHFNPDPAAGSWDALARQWLTDLDSHLAAGRTVVLQALTGTSTVFPRTFVLGGSRKVSYTASNLTNSNVQVTIVDDLTIVDACEGMNALFAQEPVQTSGTFEVQSGTFTVYTATAGTGSKTKAISTQPSDCTPIPAQVIVLCDANGQFMRHYQRTAGGSVTVVDTTLDGVTTYLPTGGIKQCGATSTLEVICRCDDTDGDGIPDKLFRSVLAIDSDGVTSILANYEQDLITPYTPISPGECDEIGDSLNRIVPRYTVLKGANKTWTLGVDSILPTTSVTIVCVAVGDPITPPTITDAVGTNPIFQGMSVGWSTQFSRDVSGLKAPLILTTNHANDVLSVVWSTETV